MSSPTWEDHAAAIRWQAAAREALPELAELIDCVGTLAKRMKLKQYGSVLVRITSLFDLGITEKAELGQLIELGALSIIRDRRVGGAREQMVIVLNDPDTWRAEQLAAA